MCVTKVTVLSIFRFRSAHCACSHCRAAVTPHASRTPPCPPLSAAVSPAAPPAPESLAAAAGLSAPAAEADAEDVVRAESRGARPLGTGLCPRHGVSEVRPCRPRAGTSFLLRAESFSGVRKDRVVFVRPPAHGHTGCFPPPGHRERRGCERGCRGAICGSPRFHYCDA